MRTLFVIASIAAVLTLASANNIDANDANATKIIEGTISSYDCGDNCYLTITDKKGKDHTGLCSAPLCSKWNEQGAMPERYKGKRVKATVSRGTRFDGAGHAVDTSEAFIRISIDANDANATKTIEGTISSYDCGDNCYLTITDKKGKDHTGLCSAPLCSKWNEQGAMPERYKGKRVKATVSRGTRFDGAGHAVDTSEAFVKIQLLK